ncbi:hypothetical protein FM996_20760, partial [Methylosinus sporium]
MSVPEFNENVLNASENQDHPTSDMLSAFNDAVSFFDNLTDDEADSFETEGAPVASDRFFGYPIAVPGCHAIELADDWSDDFLNRETVVSKRSPGA